MSSIKINRDARYKLISGAMLVLTTGKAYFDRHSHLFGISVFSNETEAEFY